MADGPKVADEKPPGAIIAGQAYGHRATLEVAKDTLTWRAQRGQLQPVPENIVTTVHDVRDVHWVEQPWSLPGAILAVLGLVWTLTDGLAYGGIALAIAIGLIAWRRTHPRLFIALDVGDRRLIMKVDVASAAPARALAVRIARALETGELPETPPALP